MSKIRNTAGSVAFATERLLNVLASGAIVSFIAVALFGIGPPIEARLWPVIGMQSVTSVEREGDIVRFSLTIDKLRECRLEKGDWAVASGGRHSAITVVNAIGNPAVGSVTLPTGILEIGPFTASLPFEAGNDTYLYAILFYDCHFGWLTRSTLGPVPVPG